VPAYRALADAFPDHKRILAAPSSLRSIARMSGFFDDLLPVKPFARLPEIRRPDTAVNLQGGVPESHQILQAARPRSLITFRQDESPGPCWRRAEHDVDRWCRLLERHGIRTNPFRLDLPRPRAVSPGCERRPSYTRERRIRRDAGRRIGGQRSHATNAPAASASS
jgi:hypothetical protein